MNPLDSINRLRVGTLATDDKSRSAGEKASPAAANAGSAPASRDVTVTLSTKAEQVQDGTPVIDQAKVDRIKTLIAEGNYSIDTDKLVDKFIELETSIRD